MAKSGALPHEVHDAIDHARALQTINQMGRLLETLAREWLRQADELAVLDPGHPAYAMARRDSANELLTAIGRKP